MFGLWFCVIMATCLSPGLAGQEWLAMVLKRRDREKGYVDPGQRTCRKSLGECDLD